MTASAIVSRFCFSMAESLGRLVAGICLVPVSLVEIVLEVVGGERVVLLHLGLVVRGEHVTVIGQHLRLEHLPILRRMIAEHRRGDHAVLIEAHVARLDLRVLLRLGRAHDLEVLALARRQACVGERRVRVIPRARRQPGLERRVLEDASVPAEDDPTNALDFDERKRLERRRRDCVRRVVEPLPIVHRRRLGRGCRRRGRRLTRLRRACIGIRLRLLRAADDDDGQRDHAR